MTTFQDIFKSDFVESVTSVDISSAVLTLIWALVIGIFIFLVYRKAYSGVMYSRSFGVTLIAITMITALVILAVTSNVVLSLGMVGALSIVRFRTAIKDPLDIAFLFWALVVGIVLAADLVPLAVVGSLMIGVVILLFSTHKSYVEPYILVVTCDSKETEEKATAYINKEVARCKVKSKSVRSGAIELNMEICIKNNKTDFMNELVAMDGVKDAVMVSYNGDYMGD